MMTIIRMGFLSICYFLLITGNTAQPGTTDSTFGIDGILELEYGAINVVSDIQATADGGLYVFGTYATSDTSIGKPFVTKIEADGSTDVSFGVNGTIFPEHGPEWVLIWDGRVLPNGDVVIAGTNPHPYDTAMYLRYHSDGTPDTSVSDTGFTYTMTDLTLTSTEKMAITSDGTVYWIGTHEGALLGDFVRILPDGTRDTGFEVQNAVSSHFFVLLGGTVIRDSLLFLNGINILIPDGTVWSYLKMNASGEIDSSFGTNGIATFSSFDQAGDEFGQGMYYSTALDRMFSLHTFSANALSSTCYVNAFSGDGTADDTLNSFSLPPLDTFRPFYSGITADASGAGYLYVGGYEQSNNETYHMPAVRRLHTDGSPDTTFGENGIYTASGLKFYWSVDFIPPIQPDVILGTNGSLYYYGFVEQAGAFGNSRIIKLRTEEEATAVGDAEQGDIPWTVVNPQADLIWEYSLPESIRNGGIISVFDRAGSLVSRETIGKGALASKGHIEVPAGLSPGMYFVLLQTEEGRAVRRVMYQPGD